VDDGGDEMPRDPQAIQGVQAHVENIVARPAASLGWAARRAIFRTGPTFFWPIPTR
jgi:hypothetical protein